MIERPLRIALLTYSTKPRGGVVHTLALAEALAEAGQSVDVWSLSRGGDAGFFRPVSATVGVRLVPFEDRDGESVGKRIVRSIVALGQAFDPAGYDVVHAQDCISANAVPHCIRTIHHLDHFTTPELVECHERAIVNPYAHICVSRAVAAEVKAEWGIEPTVISNGVDAARFAAAALPDPAAAAARRLWHERLGARFILAVGGIEPRKGTLDLIEAMGILRATHPEVPLVVAGGETLFDYRDYRRRVDQRATELGVEPVVLGAVADAELPSLVAAASVLAFPSTKEGFGLAAMEALAAGIPLVTRDLPVLREVFGCRATYGSTPQQFADELEVALTTSSRYRRESGRALAESHRWSHAADAHMRFYRATLSHREGTGSRGLTRSVRQIMTTR
jgi:glycosyltransferase-like protein